MLPKAILFDLDDTILEFSVGADPVWKAICSKYAEKTNMFDPTDLFESIKGVRDWFWADTERHKEGRRNLNQTRRIIVSKALSSLGLNRLNLAGEIADSYTKIREEGITLFPKAIETLQYLRDNRVRLALVTNGSAEKQQKKIERFNLAQFFDCVLIEGVVGIGKPDPKIYLHALKELSVVPTDAWMVGDNLGWEVTAPQKLGIYGIWHDHRGQGLPPSTTVKPDRIINRISELRTV